MSLQTILDVFSGKTLRDIQAERASLEAVRDTIAHEAEVFASSEHALVRGALEELLSGEVLPRLPALQQIVSETGARHRNTPLIMAALKANVPAWIHGDAGSGKTTAAFKAAHALGLQFRFISVCPTTTKSELLGYMDATGTYRGTAFREIFENGGVFLIDEIDNGNPSILAILNAALANGYCAFPDGNVKRHEEARFLAAANTIGRGADVRYIGRNALDATTLDRFVYVRMDIDENLEGALVGQRFNPKKIANLALGGSVTPEDWYGFVTQVRETCHTLGIQHLVSPRATLYGVRLIEAGVGRTHLEEMCIWKGLRDTDRTKIQENLGERRRRAA